MATYDLDKIFKNMEDYLIASMKRNLKGHRMDELVEGFKWEQWQAQKLRDLTKFRRRNMVYFSKNVKLDSIVSTMLKNQFLEGGKKVDKEMSAMIKRGLHLKRSTPSKDFFEGDSKKLQSLIKAITNDMDNAAYAALRNADDVYRKTVLNASMYAGSGTQTVSQAIDMASKEFLEKGITCITYKNGAKVGIESYTKMAIRTANKRAHLMGEGERRKEWGEPLVLVSQYLQCSPLCLPWQGKVYIDDVYSGGKVTDGSYPLLSTAIQGKLFHPNCRHTMSTYFEDLTEVPDPLRSENGEKYEQAQKKAEALRNERKYERLASGSLDDGNVQKYRKKQKEWEERA